MGTADRSGLADRIHGWLEITHDIAGMKVFAPAFVATMILVTLDQLLFDGQFTEPVFTALSYVGGVIVDRI